MDFQEFLRKVKADIEFIYPENPRLGLVWFLTAVLKQVIEKDKTLAERIVKHLEFASPLISIGSNLSPNKKYVLHALANFRVPDMRGRVKPKKLQNISIQYREIYEKVKPIFKRRYRDPGAKLHYLHLSINERLGMNIPKEKLKKWLDCEPREFSVKCLAYKHKWDKHPETILRYVRKERKKKPSTFDLISELAEKLSTTNDSLSYPQK